MRDNEREELLASEMPDYPCFYCKKCVKRPPCHKWETWARNKWRQFRLTAKYIKENENA